MRPIYLDYNATTPIAPNVQEAMLPFLAEHYGIPISSHALGRAAAQAIDDARYRVAKAIGAEADEVYFTSGATESCRAAASLRPQAFVTTSVDHWAMRTAGDDTNRTIVPAPSSGVMTPEAVENATANGASLVSVVHANNELGIVQTVSPIAARLKQWGVLVHSDAAQSFGKLPVDVAELGVDLLTFTAHKAYGPKGAGALYVRRGVSLGETFNDGATLSPGTPDLMAIVGFGVAAELASRSVPDSAPRMQSLRDQLQEQLRDGVGSDLIVWGEDAQRLPNTLAVAFPNVVGEELLNACPEICATPLATRSGESIELSATLQAIGADPLSAQGSIRLSLGWYTDQEQIDRAASLLLDAWERLKK